MALIYLCQALGCFLHPWNNKRPQETANSNQSSNDNPLPNLIALGYLLLGLLVNATWLSWVLLNRLQDHFSCWIFVGFATPFSITVFPPQNLDISEPDSRRWSHHCMTDSDRNVKPHCRWQGQYRFRLPALLPNLGEVSMQCLLSVIRGLLLCVLCDLYHTLKIII